MTTYHAYADHLSDGMSLSDAARDPAVKGHLSTRAWRMLERGIFSTVGDMRRASDREFAQIPGCGVKTRNELRWAFGANPRPDDPLRWCPSPTQPAEYVIADDGQVYISAQVNLDRNREIVRLHASGLSKQAIADRFGITAPRAHQIIRDMPAIETKLAAAVRVTRLETS